MDDYRPLDLGAVTNAGLEALGGSSAPVGRQRFWGLPFQIGAKDQGACFLVAGGTDLAARCVAVGEAARNLIFAHRLLDSDLLEGSPVGVWVAEYVVRYADGAEARLPVRERFEIATVLCPDGHPPFVAIPDQQERLWPRHEGRWGDADRRQTEGMAGQAPAIFCGPGAIRVRRWRSSPSRSSPAARASYWPRSPWAISTSIPFATPAYAQLRSCSRRPRTRTSPATSRSASTVAWRATPTACRPSRQRRSWTTH